jgi:hypothetical protein
MMETTLFSVGATLALRHVRALHRDKNKCGPSNQIKSHTSNITRDASHTYSEFFASKNMDGLLTFSPAHVDAFLRLDCAPSLLQMGLFPKNIRTQEISESMACVSAVDKHLSPPDKNNHHHKRNNGPAGGPFGGCGFCEKNDLCVVVGDGSTPRTAALLAYRTRWERIIPIDPALGDLMDQKPGTTPRQVGYQSWPR